MKRSQAAKRRHQRQSSRHPMDDERLVKSTFYPSACLSVSVSCLSPSPISPVFLSRQQGGKESRPCARQGRRAQRPDIYDPDACLRPARRHCKGPAPSRHCRGWGWWAPTQPISVSDSPRVCAKANVYCEPDMELYNAFLFVCRRAAHRWRQAWAALEHERTDSEEGCSAAATTAATATSAGCPPDDRQPSFDERKQQLERRRSQILRNAWDSLAQAERRGLAPSLKTFDILVGGRGLIKKPCHALSCPHALTTPTVSPGADGRLAAERRGTAAD